MSPCKSILHPYYAAVEDDRIGISVKDEEWSDIAQCFPDVAVVKHPAFWSQRSCEEDLGVTEPQRKKQPSPERTDLNSALSLVGASYIGVAHRIVELFDIRIHQDVKVLHGSIVYLWPVKFYIDGRPWRQILHEELRKSARSYFIDRVHHNAVSMGKFKVHVHPRLVLQFGQVEFPHRKHHLSVSAVQFISVDVDIIKIIIGPYGLELFIRPQKRGIIP